jgi:hypothetical protein
VVASSRKQFKYYLFTQCVGWGIFLILRMVLTAMYCARHPEVDCAQALFWECFDHLAQAFSSHLIWMWMHGRKLFDKGWKALFLEGYMVALALSVVLTLIVWHPFHKVYAGDFSRLGASIMGLFILMQHALVTVLWFSGLLAMYFFQRARTLELQQAETTAAAREAQLLALKGQINPHFLFNSFNSLRALIDENPTLARDAVTHLAVIMRYALTSAERKFVPLSEELRVVGLYLELEKLRLGDRLTVVMQIEPGLESIQIPPLLLQGLVENSVKFGPAARKQGGDVTCHAERQNGHLILRVSNPGKLDTPSESTGLGIKNLRDRLALLFGEEATFDLSETGDRVVAEVKLPVGGPPLS